MSRRPRRTNWDAPEYDNSMGFLDTLSNFNLVFASLFILAFLLIRPQAPADSAVKLRAEFIFTLSWPDGALDDIDLWVMLPDGRKVFYNNRNVEFATLDRDDLGGVGDIFTDAAGTRQINHNHKEMVTIRAIVPGRYVASAHVYLGHDKIADSITGKVFESEAKLPYAVNLEVMKLNPRVATVATAKATLTEQNEEQPLVAFDVDGEGNVTKVELNPIQYKIVGAPATGSP